jgi:hypothetical protein
MRPICQINLIYTKTPSHVQLHQTHRVRDIPTTVCRRRCLSLPRSQQTHCRNKSHTIPLCSIRARNPHWTGGESSKTACVFFPPPQFFNDNDTFSPPRITEGRADGDPGLSYPPSPSDLCAHVRQSESARIAREDAKYDALPETAKIDVSTGCLWRHHPSE